MSDVGEYLFGNRDQAGAFGTGQHRPDARPIDKNAFNNPYSKETREELLRRRAAAENRQAQKMEGTTVGPMERAHLYQAGPTERASAPNAKYTAAQNANLNRGEDRQMRDTQVGLIQELQRQQRGEGAAQKLAESTYRESSDRSYRQMMGILASGAGGATSPAAQQRMLLEQKGEADIAAQRALAQDKLRAQAEATGQLAGVAGQARGQDLSAAEAQARLEQEANLQNAQEQNANSRFNSSLASELSRFNAGEANTTARFNAQEGNTQGRFNAGEANESTRLQAQLDQERRRADLEAYYKQQGLNDDMVRYYTDRQMQADEADRQARMEYEGMATKQDMHTNEIDAQAYESARGARRQFTEGISKAVMSVGAAALSDERTKTGVTPSVAESTAQWEKSFGQSADQARDEVRRHDNKVAMAETNRSLGLKSDGTKPGFFDRLFGNEEMGITGTMAGGTGKPSGGGGGMNVMSELKKHSDFATQYQSKPSMAGSAGGAMSGSSFLTALGAISDKREKIPTIPGIPNRFLGGPVQAGQPYIVGEKGPEVIVPNQSGTVVPNQNTSVFGDTSTNAFGDTSKESKAKSQTNQGASVASDLGDQSQPKQQQPISNAAKEKTATINLNINTSNDKAASFTPEGQGGRNVSTVRTYDNPYGEDAKLEQMTDAGTSKWNRRANLIDALMGMQRSDSRGVMGRQADLREMYANNGMTDEEIRQYTALHSPYYRNNTIDRARPSTIGFNQEAQQKFDFDVQAIEDEKERRMQAEGAARLEETLARLAREEQARRQKSWDDAVAFGTPPPVVEEPKLTDAQRADMQRRDPSRPPDNTGNWAWDNSQGLWVYTPYADSSVDYGGMGPGYYAEQEKKKQAALAQTWNKDKNNNGIDDDMEALYQATNPGWKSPPPNASPPSVNRDANEDQDGNGVPDWLDRIRYSVSDKRAKLNVKPVDPDVSDFIKQLDPSTYYYKNPNMPGAAKGKQLGITAQQLEKSNIGKNYVHEDESGMKRVDTEHLTTANTALLKMHDDRLTDIERVLGARHKKGRK